AGLDAHARQLSEAGVDAVDRLALGDDGIDGARAGLDRRAACVIERDRGTEIDTAPVGEGDIPGVKGDRLFGHVRSPEAAAEWRENFTFPSRPGHGAG